LPAAHFAEEHLPGAVSLPLDALGPRARRGVGCIDRERDAIERERAEAVLGADRERPVVVYCSSYG